MLKSLKTYASTLFDPMVVITLMTTATLIIAVAALTNLSFGWKVTIAILSVIVGGGTIVLQIRAILQRKEIRHRLGLFMQDGLELASRCANEHEPAPEDAAQQWLDELDAYVRENMSEADATKLHSSAGLPVGVTSIVSLSHQRLWSGIRLRLARLAELMSQL